MLKNLITKLIITILLVLPLLMPLETAKAAPSLTLQKSANKTRVEPGGTITYTIIATNSGTSEAQNVRIEDPINPDLLNAETIQYIGPTGTYDRTTRKIIWTNLPNIQAGGSLTLSFSIQQGRTPDPVPLGSVRAVSTNGQYAYMASYDYGLVVVDVRVPSRPAGIGKLSLPFLPSDLDSEGSRAVVVGGSRGITVVDISNPLSPSLIQYFNNIPAYGLVIKNGYAYLTDKNGYLRILNLETLNLESQFQLPGQPQGIDVVNGYAFVSVNTEMKIVDVRNPASPSIVSAISRPGQRVTAKPGFAYTDTFADNGGFTVINVSNLLNPFEEGGLFMLFPDIIMDMQVSGDFIYLGINDGWNSSMRIYRISDPDNPQIQGIFWNPRVAGAYGLDVAGNYVYLADGGSGLKIIDVSNPSQPRLIGSAT